MGAHGLEKLVPLLEVLPVLARLRAQELQRLVSLERRAVNTGNDGAETRVVMQVSQPVRDVDELLDLSSARLRLIVTEDQ